MATSRPSVIRHAEIVVFIRNGRVEQVGTNTELMKLSSEYRTLIESYEGTHEDE
jgi:ABC-type multidrug transport system fused ATPase/permease subunit